jgi:hypothetical protein
MIDKYRYTVQTGWRRGDEPKKQCELDADPQEIKKGSRSVKEDKEKNPRWQ